MKTVVLVSMCFVVAVSSVYGQDTTVRENCGVSIEKLEKALKEHNFGLVEDLFHEDFDYAGLGCGGHCNSSKMVASMVISTYPHKVKSIALKDVQAEGPDYQVLTTFSYLDAQDDTEKEAEFVVLMTCEGQFLGMEFPGVKLLIGGQDAAQTEGGSCGAKGE